MNKEYKEYLKSNNWKLKKAEVLKVKKNKCESCGSTKKLEVHHKTYKNIFKESLSDLKLLCRNCHMKEHNIITPFQKKIRLMEKRKRKRRKNKYL